MRSISIAVILLVGCGSAERRSAGPIPPWDNKETLAFVYLAVIEGLTADSPDPKVLRPILDADKPSYVVDPKSLKPILDAEKPGYFVHKCPICEPVRSAFISYLAPFEKGECVYYPAPIGTGLPKEIQAKLVSQERKARLDGMENLVARYVQARFDRLRMTADERRQMIESLLAAKNFGMQLNTPGENCANCVGATRR